MAKSIIRFLFVIPAVIFIGYLALQLRQPSSLTVNHWILTTELSKCISGLGDGDWHQAWFHLSRTFTTEGHILVALILLILLGIKHYFGGSKKQAPAVVREVDDLQSKANRLGTMGLSCSESGQIEQAIDYYVQALDISRKIGDHQVVGNTLGNLGNAHLTLGKVQKAIGYHEQALGIFRRIGFRHGEGSVLGNIGRAYLACGQVDKAIMYNKQSLSVFEKINSPYAVQMRKWISDLENQGKQASG